MNSRSFELAPKTSQFPRVALGTVRLGYRRFFVTYHTEYYSLPTTVLLYRPPSLIENKKTNSSLLVLLLLLYRCEDTLQGRLLRPSRATRSLHYRWLLVFQQQHSPGLPLSLSETRTWSGAARRREHGVCCCSGKFIVFVSIHHSMDQIHRINIPGVPEGRTARCVYSSSR